jgi:fatty-acyl-CoA synthase
MLVKAETGTQHAVSALPDVEAFERVPLEGRHSPSNTYEMLARGAAIAQDAPALSFFLRTKDFRKPLVWTHRELFAAITRTANALRRLGIGRDDVVAYLLPNLPETHFVIWGGEAAGIVFAINPMLESDAISELLEAGKAKWLVTLAPSPGADIWEKAAKAAVNVPSLMGVLIASVTPYVRGLTSIALQMQPQPRKLKRGSSFIPVMIPE